MVFPQGIAKGCLRTENAGSSNSSQHLLSPYVLRQAIVPMVFKVSNSIPHQTFNLYRSHQMTTSSTSLYKNYSGWSVSEAFHGAHDLQERDGLFRPSS